MFPNHQTIRQPAWGGGAETHHLSWQPISSAALCNSWMLWIVLRAWWLQPGCKSAEKWSLKSCRTFPVSGHQRHYLEIETWCCSVTAYLWWSFHEGELNQFCQVHEAGIPFLLCPTGRLWQRHCQLSLFTQASLWKSQTTTRLSCCTI